MMRKILTKGALAGALIAGVALPGLAADGFNKFQVVKPVINEESGFLLRLDVDHKDRIYREGDTMTVSVEAEKDCYLYLIYYDAQGGITCLFPNGYHKDNAIKAMSK